MFIGYNVDLTNVELEVYLKTGESSSEQQKTKFRQLLSRYIGNGVVDGTKLQSDWFPDSKADIFISHSHNDEKLAQSFAGFLEEVFGVSVFIDSNVWGSADRLLKDIDKIYARGNSPNVFDYRKRNFTTSHVHMMLANSIMKVMDSAECIFLLNTEEAIPKISEMQDKDCTYSPWLYTEIMMMQMLRKRQLTEHREKSVFESFEKHANQDLKIKYDINLDKLIPINWDDIVAWQCSYELRTNSGEKLRGRCDSPLDDLYKATIENQRLK